MRRRMLEANTPASRSRGSGRQARLAATNALLCSDLHVASALGGGGRLHAGVETMAREIAVMSGRVETHDLAEIRDVDYVTVYSVVSYIETGAVSRTSLNCAPLSSSRRAGFPGAPRSVRSLSSSHATFHQGEM